MYRLHVTPDEKTLTAPPEQSLLDTLAKAGIALISPCGGEGTCGKCRCKASGALNPPTVAERTQLGELLEQGFRLSCQSLPHGDVSVEIPDASRVPNIRVLAGGASRDVPFFPNVRQRPFRWEKLDLEATGSQFDVVARLLNARADLRVDLPVARELAHALRIGTEYHGVVLGDRLVEVREGTEPTPLLGVAVDVGTTTVVTQIVHLGTGENVSTASALNDQTQFGGDVITRINHANESPEGLAELSGAVRGTIQRCLENALAKSKYTLTDIYEMTVVGNTTMLHLFAGVHPRSLGQLPYSPVFSRGMDIPAEALGFALNPRANVFLLPSIAGYVGADTVGAMIATRFDEDDGRVRLLADIGTNCEIVLQKGGELLACSTPAGPAFEGARMDYGMLAGPGAIERVRFDTDCEIRVIGNETPQGICGSGIVDIAAELFRVGILDDTGRIQGADELLEALPPMLMGRIHEREKGNVFELAVNADGAPILFTQHDVREIQLAKAAIRSGIETLLDLAGVRPDELDEVLIAGGFGNYLNKENAQRLGMIPNVALDRVKFVGNAALVGSRLALVSIEMRSRAERLARTIRHIQIAGTPNFRMRFTEAMLFGDMTLL
jgi:uncharacterized 2Fe-2S/4Fe-4S cluster protein (DUF4445 family)